MFGKKGVTSIVASAIALVIMVVLTTTVIMPTLKTANITGWTAQEVQIWNILGVFVVLGVLVTVVFMFVARGGRL